MADQGMPNEGREGDAPSDVEKPRVDEQSPDKRSQGTGGENTTGAPYTGGAGGAGGEGGMTPAEDGELEDDDLAVDQGDDDRDAPQSDSDGGAVTGQ